MDYLTSFHICDVRCVNVSSLFCTSTSMPNVVFEMSFMWPLRVYKHPQFFVGFVGVVLVGSCTLAACMN